jgi:hypothetical protein
VHEKAGMLIQLTPCQRTLIKAGTTAIAIPASQFNFFKNILII